MKENKFDFFEHFTAAIEEDKETAVNVEQVFDFIRSLPLSAADNDKLVKMMTGLLRTARKNMYLAGGCAAARLFLE